MSDGAVAAGRDRARICREIGDALWRLTAAHSRGTLNERDFVEAMLQLEREKASEHDLVLTATNTRDEWTSVVLRVKGSSEPCAAFEYLPGTGAFRPFGSSDGQQDDRMALAI